VTECRSSGAAVRAWARHMTACVQCASRQARRPGRTAGRTWRHTAAYFAACQKRAELAARQLRARVRIDHDRRRLEDSAIPRRRHRRRCGAHGERRRVGEADGSPLGRALRAEPAQSIHPRAEYSRASAQRPGRPEAVGALRSRHSPHERSPQRWRQRSAETTHVSGIERRWQGVSPVPAQMWQGQAQSWCRCGSGEFSPGADVVRTSPRTR
jgi:hypothetical protein